MPNVHPEQLHGVIAAVFELAGATTESARVVADSLVDAECAGQNSHGAIRVVEYLGQIRDGRLVPRAAPVIERETKSTLLVDGSKGFGQVIARWTTQRLIEKALEHDIALAGIFHCGHIGRVGPYPALAAERGLVCLAFVNGGGTTPRVAPFGGSVPMFGTNPIAAAVPVSGSSPIVVDFSTAVVASGRIRVLRDRGETLPEGWILDHEGRPSRDANAYYNGGMLLPAAGHKGYGLALLTEVLGGLLTTAGSPILSRDPSQVGNGTCLVALNPAAFLPLEQFTDSVKAMSDAVRATPPAPGFEEVQLPGDPERASAARSARVGIHVADATWRELLAAARDLGLDISPWASIDP